MPKILHCRDAGFDCDATVQGETTQDILDQVRPHAAEVHHVQIDEPMAHRLQELIRQS
jgi:predicted small metal-binding protein